MYINVFGAQKNSTENEPYLDNWYCTLNRTQSKTKITTNTPYAQLCKQSTNFYTLFVGWAVSYFEYIYKKGESEKEIGLKWEKVHSAQFTYMLLWKIPRTDKINSSHLIVGCLLLVLRSFLYVCYRIHANTHIFYTYTECIRV